MNSLDSVIILIILVFTGLGLAHGLIRSISSLVAIVVGLYLAKKLEPFISKILLFVHIRNPEGVIGYIFVFFCIFIAVKIILLVLQKLTKASGLSVVDRAFGGALGLVKGLIIVVVITAIIQVALPRNSAVLTQSKFLPLTNKMASTAHAVIPNAIYKHVVVKAKQ